MIQKFYPSKILRNPTLPSKYTEEKGCRFLKLSYHNWAVVFNRKSRIQKHIQIGVWSQMVDISKIDCKLKMNKKLTI